MKLPVKKAAANANTYSQPVALSMEEAAFTAAFFWERSFIGGPR
jgi:hypothetical protein